MTTSGIKRLRRIQAGRETTDGTAVAATTILRGPALMAVDDRVLVMPDENVGLSSLTTRIYTPKLLASLDFPETEATFEQVQHTYENGIKTATINADGVGTGKIGVYTVPSGDANTIKHYTLEGGDNKVAEEIEYCFTTEFQLSGKINEAWKISRKVQGRQNAVTTFTPALSIPTVEEMLFNKSKLYIDNVGGTIGATQISNTWLGAVIKVVTGWKAQFVGDGNLYFAFPEFIGAKVTVELELLHNATTAAERELWRAGTPRQIRIQTEGSNLTTPGTLFSKKTHRFDAAGVYTMFGPPNDENEGSNVNKVTFECAYDGTAAKFAEFTTVNQLAAVP